MRLFDVKRNEPFKVQRKGKVLEFIEEFEESGKDIMEVSFSTGEYKSSYTCATVLEQSIKRAHKETILKAFTRHKKVYIAKKSYLKSFSTGIKALDISLEK